MKKNKKPLPTFNFGLILLLLLVSIFSLITVRLLSGDEDLWTCKDGEWVQHGNPMTAKPSSFCGGDSGFNWLRARQLISDCKVKKVSQSKNLNVKLFMSDGTIKETKEPNMNNVINLAKFASVKCGFAIKTVTE